MKTNLLFLLAIAFLFSCNNKYEAKDPDEGETINSGKLTVYCDESLQVIMDSTFLMYQDDYDKVELTVKYTDSRNVMANLLGGKSRVVVNPRGYLPDEDSLMDKYDVQPHKKLKVAHDALVFFTNKNFPVDTLNSDQIEAALVNGESLSKNTVGLNFEPKYAIADQNSSEFANFNKMIIKNRSLKRKVYLKENIDSVKKLVRQNNSIIGIGYLSQLVKDTTFKMIPLGFYSDSLEQQVRPKPVHQGYVVQDKYPFKVTYYAYLLKDRTDLPYWFATYLAKEKKVQKYFLDYGIVPAFAEIKLVFEE